MILVFALTWPIWPPAWLAFQIVGKERFDRVYGAWWRSRGFYFENVRHADGTYHALMMRLDETGPCKGCARTAPKMCIGSDGQPPSAEGCRHHPHLFLCPNHRSEKDIEKMLDLGTPAAKDSPRELAL